MVEKIVLSTSGAGTTWYPHVKTISKNWLKMKKDLNVRVKTINIL